MSLLDALLPPTLLPAIGEALLHSLWQGALVAAAVALGLRFLAKDDPEARHGLALGGLAVLVLGFAWSLGRALTPGAEGSALASLHALTGLSPAELAARVRGVGAGDAGPLALDDARTWAAALWLLGLATMTLRLGRAQAWSRRLRRASVAPAGTDLQARVDELARALGLRRAPRLLLSPRVESPALVGWWRPVLLLPLCALSGLTPDQLRAVLAHELAHLRRLDHTVNAFLALAEWLLFFHPATWWLAGVVRREREHCCDRTAVHLTGQPRRLAEALARLESLRAPDATPTLAARDGDGPLLRRITHILEPTTMKTLHARSRRLRAALLLTGLLVGTGWTRAALANAATPDAAAVAELGDPEEDLEVLRQRLREAVDTGHLSNEEARRVLWALEASVAERERESRAALEEQWRRAGAELKAAVERGDVTPAEAKEALGRLRERVSRSSGDRRAVERDARRDDRRAVEDDLRAKYDALQREVEDAVLSGRLSKEDARQKLDVVADEWMRHADELAEREAREHAVRDDAARRTERQRDLDRVSEKLEAAVRSGRLSKEDARREWAALTEDRAREDAQRARDAKAAAEEARSRDLDDAHRHLVDVADKLEQAVRAGVLTGEEARREYIEAARQWKESARDADRVRGTERKPRSGGGAGVGVGVGVDSGVGVGLDSGVSVESRPNPFGGAVGVESDPSAANPFRVVEERRSGRGTVRGVESRPTSGGGGGATAGGGRVLRGREVPGSGGGGGVLVDVTPRVVDGRYVELEVTERPATGSASGGGSLGRRVRGVETRPNGASGGAHGGTRGERIDRLRDLGVEERPADPRGAEHGDGGIGTDARIYVGGRSLRGVDVRDARIDAVDARVVEGRELPANPFGGRVVEGRELPTDPFGGRNVYDRIRTDVETVEVELRSAVDAGLLSPEDAKRKMEALRRRLDEVEDDLEHLDRRRRGESGSRARRPKSEVLEEALKRAVEEGKLDAAEAKAKIEALRGGRSGDAGARSGGGSSGGGGGGGNR